MIGPRSVVIVALNNPREKYWGRLEALDVSGVQICGMELNMVEEWAREIARGETPSLGLATVFFPLSRVERLYLDETIGAARSVAEAFGSIVGRPVGDFFPGEEAPGPARRRPREPHRRTRH